MENINELNKHVEILSRPTSTSVTVLTLQDPDGDSVTSHEGSGNNEEPLTIEASNEIVSSTPVAFSTCDAPTISTLIISDTPVVRPTSIAISTTPLTVSLLESAASTTSLPVSSLHLTPSISVSSSLYPSVSYVHSLRPPPLIPRVTTVNQYQSLPAFTDDPLLLPLPTLSLGTSSSPSLTGEPTVTPRISSSLARVMPTTLDQHNHSQQFATSMQVTQTDIAIIFW